jgi:hypothetical protein
MKTLFLSPALIFLLLTNAVYSQIVDCSKLSVTNIAYHSQDSTAEVFIYYADSTKGHINYPFVASVLNADTKDTISAKSGTRYFAHFPKSGFTYTIPARKSWPATYSYNVNFQFTDLVEHPNSPSEIHTCPLVYKAIERLDCNKLKLIRDTVTIDFAKNTSDLKYTYSNEKPLNYPNFKYESHSKDLTIPNGFQQTYLMGNEFEFCADLCKFYTPYHYGMKFSTNVTAQVFVPGVFTIGHLDKNTCSFNIVYKLDPSKITGMAEIATEGIKLYPNPTDDILNVKFGNDKQYKVFEATGREVVSGFINAGQINIEDLKPGIYFLKIEEKYYTIFKK